MSRRRLMAAALSAAFATVVANEAHGSTPALGLDLAFGPRVPPEMRSRLQVWADALKGKIDVWWPTIVASLASDGFTLTAHLTLSFYKIDDPNIPAFTTRGPRINVDPWKLIVRLDNPDTFGMVAHELVHVAQAYPSGAKPGWITEGIADYLRYYVLLPEDPGRYFDPRGLSATSGYQPTAGLLDWVEAAHPDAVRQINTVMRAGGDGGAELARIGAAQPDALWRTYMATRPRAANPDAAARRARAIQS